MYQFNWDWFNESDFKKAKAKSPDPLYADDYVGAVRVGDLCFDFVLREFSGELTLTYDLYVGGVDEGYGTSRIKESYPYTYADGGSFPTGWGGMQYDRFCEMAESVMSSYIESCGYTDHYKLTEKASAPLNVW